MARKNYVFYERGNYNLNLIGVRRSVNNLDNFDDALMVIYKVKGEWIIDCFPITTDSGKYYLKNPLTDKGTAILCEGQYRGAYRIGIHNNSHRALIQSLPVKVYRDNNRDDQLDFKNPEWGMFGINIHRSSRWGSEKVGKYSAGCQVFFNYFDWVKFDKLFVKASKIYGDTFSYTLINEGDFYCINCQTAN